MSGRGWLFGLYRITGGLDMKYANRNNMWLDGRKKIQTSASMAMARGSEILRPERRTDAAETRKSN